jgi:hypothetical protein
MVNMKYSAVRRQRQVPGKETRMMDQVFTAQLALAPTLTFSLRLERTIPHLPNLIWLLPNLEYLPLICIGVDGRVHDVMDPHGPRHLAEGRH